MTEQLPPAHVPPQADGEGLVDLSLMPTFKPTQLRADAARNRTRLLEVAARLAAERGIANVTMEDIACGAGVGKGTVFRRFGDRAGLLVELLSHQEEQFQTVLISGPPPLGPGAPAVERLHAFGSGVVRHEHAHRDLYLAAHADPARHRLGAPYQFRLAHVAMLLREARAEGDLELVAHTLLGYLETVLVDHLLTRRGMPVERVEAGWRDLVDRFTHRCGG
ncbi:TetR/AcrR family transcriptional regulator [Streptomyces chiangmaiensis]|uniref:Helix-turn-helix domain-containing protein n=1 Tax=Streptomyces chiangmaiensis TaxID=766497 RepID=A0ABU7FEB1_9ACTN|nr:helix-turn-helix domain-containing protein [Streptomyces chiangmaiensis]MED7822235.1 helix-turn-helix domain-containing protein [Streptomyces chiangmaiensis]